MIFLSTSWSLTFPCRQRGTEALSRLPRKTPQPFRLWHTGSPSQYRARLSPTPVWTIKKKKIIRSGCEKAIHFSLLLYSSATFLFYSPRAEFRQMQIRKHHRLHCELETRKWNHKMLSSTSPLFAGWGPLIKQLIEYIHPHLLWCVS